MSRRHLHLPQASRPEPLEQIRPLDLVVGVVVLFLILFAAVVVLPVLVGPGL
jgi:hypothetical protein